jgi:hypothetical protein
MDLQSTPPSPSTKAVTVGMTNGDSLTATVTTRMMVEPFRPFRLSPLAPLSPSVTVPSQTVTARKGQRVQGVVQLPVTLSPFLLKLRENSKKDLKEGWRLRQRGVGKIWSAQ